MIMEKKVILITGASSGIGYQTAEMLAREGHKVYGAARHVESLEALKPLGVEGIDMDVTDNASMEAGVKAIIDKEGRIDILINNAGYGSYGSIEEVPIDEAKRQLEVNVFGAMRLVQLVLPYMRKQHFGRIINTSSIGGRITTYFGGWYHASKYAIEALSNALRMELQEFGIDVVLIEPGGIKTEWGIIAANKLKETVKGTPYEKAGNTCADGMIKLYSGNRLSKPEVVAKTMCKAVKAKRPKARYLCGYMARLIVYMGMIMPTRMFDYVMKHST